MVRPADGGGPAEAWIGQGVEVDTSSLQKFAKGMMDEGESFGKAFQSGVLPMMMDSPRAGGTGGMQESQSFHTMTNTFLMRYKGFMGEVTQGIGALGAGGMTIASNYIGADAYGSASLAKVSSAFSPTEKNGVYSNPTANRPQPNIQPGNDPTTATAAEHQQQTYTDAQGRQTDKWGTPLDKNGNPVRNSNAGGSTPPASADPGSKNRTVGKGDGAYQTGTDSTDTSQLPEDASTSHVTNNVNGPS